MTELKQAARVLHLKRVTVRAHSGYVGGKTAFGNFAQWDAHPSHIYCGRRNHYVAGSYDSPFCNRATMDTKKDLNAERKRVIAAFVSKVVVFCVVIAQFCRAGA